MEDSEFATTILTSKSPEEVANFLPRALSASSTLIQKNLIVWFTNYANMLMKYNSDLNVLVSNGRTFFADSDDEFGSLDKIWNCVASCVMSQINVNDSLIRVIKNDVIAPFSNTFKNDFKYSELLVNSEELLEMQKHMDDPNGAYNWNVKAPAILANLENFKRFEKDVIFNAFIAYLNTVNSKNSAMLAKNEGAVNFILKEFNLDNEMKKYTEHMVNAHVAPPPPPPSSASHNGPNNHAPLSEHSHSSRASVHSATSGNTSPSHKRKSKLRSKVGSIFGRRKKESGFHPAGAIPENESMSSLPSRQNTIGAKNSLYGPSSIQQRGSHAETESPTKDRFPQRENYDSPTKQAEDAPRPIDKDVVEPKKEATLPSMSTQPLQPKTFQNESPQKDEVPPLTSPTKDSTDVSPNVVKYASSDEDSDVPVDVDGNRMGMLKAHDLGHPPKLEAESNIRSRNNSSGKYSFEYGDEDASISTTPKQTPRSNDIVSFPTISSAASSEQQTSPHVAAPVEQPLLQSTTARPPPPPSRKVHPVPEHDSLHKQDTGSQFKNLNSARESVIQPHSEERSFLSTQTTGNSMFKHNEYFKHFGQSEVSEGLNTSVAEILNVTFSAGTPSKSQVLGEMAFNYNSETPLSSYVVTIPTKFNKYLLNEQVMKQVGTNSFSVNIPSVTGRTLGGIKYMMDLDPAYIPIIIKQVWKFEPHQASLIVKISLNPTFKAAINLENFVISAALDTSVSSTSASSKPEGSFNKEYNRITWRYSKPLTLSPSAPEEKLIARIMTEGQGRESPKGIQAKFTVHNLPFSFAKILDSDNNDVPSVRSLSSGNYTSHV
ncbi:putative suppressor of profilin deletion protein [Clavispora lusitaniae]|uniref:MHD domain-containing protein n=2 Tax=Clavispora lusitaniae TaxID=36911 RepID=C4Y3T8_CLAL4|nr:uncharacterized protein CLUG_02310 [Clavispora lusitaniae ATCC 42720]KAF5211550.1 hypothetical protein E0198_002865 [Clavispora lusitaniae]EEQ38184.1 hypothetical protein CLUG_02310 [Clavispora lusitaniae ATCC 42720]KAF7580408.1 hypothetical protein FOB63_005478 [Clavispora lusitaniae]QFZ27975.1 putative suppressor of profilin deletion protein [Clavispora lusitaniae]QFZ32718.1 putative suppressor of profilin deletion protein [Clavispora lusitaniae]